MKVKERFGKYLRVTLIGLSVTAGCFVVGFFESLLTKAPSVIISYGIVFAILWVVWRALRFVFGLITLYTTNGKRF